MGVIKKGANTRAKQTQKNYRIIFDHKTQVMQIAIIMQENCMEKFRFNNYINKSKYTNTSHFLHSMPS